MRKSSKSSFVFIVLTTIIISGLMYGYSQSQEVVSAPVLEIGDKWERSNNRTYEVIKQEDGYYVVLVTAGAQKFEEYWDKNTLAASRWRRPNDGTFYKVYDPPLILLSFPLTLSKGWNQSYRIIPSVGSFSGGSGYYRTIKVTKWEEIRVPAGKFRALRLETEFTPLGRSTFPIREVYWYVPEVKGIAKYQTDIINPDIRSIIEFELVKFSPATPKVALEK